MKFKRFLSVIMTTFIVSAIFAGCSNSIPTKEVDGSAVSANEEKTFGAGETAVFDNLKITASEMKESTGDDFFKPADGNIFVSVNFTIENTSDEDISVSSILQFNAYVDDVICEYSLNAACAFDEGTIDGTIAPGKKLVGCYAVEVSEDWTELELQFKNDVFGTSSESAAFIFTK